MSGYIKYFENGGKNMSLMVKNNNVLDEYDETWDKIKEKLNINFHSRSVYDEKYIKAKVREFDGVIKTNFQAIKCQKKKTLHINSVMRMDKKNYGQVYLGECQCKMKKTKITKFINTELESESGSELGSDAELEARLKSDPDSDPG